METRLDETGWPTIVRAGFRPAALLPAALLPAVCVLVSLLLVLERLSPFQLPGCGPSSACAQATGSRWGSLPGLHWPLAFVGFAYFEAILVAWIRSSGQLSPLLRWIARCGAAVSAVLVAVMFREGYVCGYCLAIHGCNLAFVISVEITPRVSSPSKNGTRQRGLLPFAATFVIASLLLAAVQRYSVAATEQNVRDQLTASIEDARCNLADDKKGSTAKPTNADRTPPAGGRYWRGEESAAVRMIVISDYQCPSCRTIDRYLRDMLAGRKNIAISAMHFPFCTDCNSHIRRTRHANACNAARAAEAAGIFGGGDTFWKMHHWLFDRKGTFSEADLKAVTAELGFDHARFVSTMLGDEVTRLLQADAAAADAAGIRFTPMVFINGEEVADFGVGARPEVDAETVGNE